MDLHALLDAGETNPTVMATSAALAHARELDAKRALSAAENRENELRALLVELLGLLDDAQNNLIEGRVLKTNDSLIAVKVAIINTLKEE